MKLQEDFVRGYPSTFKFIYNLIFKTYFFWYGNFHESDQFLNLHPLEKFGGMTPTHRRVKFRHIKSCPPHKQNRRVSKFFRQDLFLVRKSWLFRSNVFILTYLHISVLKNIFFHIFWFLIISALLVSRYVISVSLMSMCRYVIMGYFI